MLFFVKLNGHAVFRGVERNPCKTIKALKICCKIVSKTCVQMLSFDQYVKEKSLQNSYIEMQLLACVVVHR